MAAPLAIAGYDYDVRGQGLEHPGQDAELEHGAQHAGIARQDQKDLDSLRALQFGAEAAEIVVPVGDDYVLRVSTRIGAHALLASRRSTAARLPKVSAARPTRPRAATAGPIDGASLPARRGIARRAHQLGHDGEGDVQF